MALLMGGATAFFFIAMPMALGAVLHVLVAGGAALFAGGLTWVAIGLADKADSARLRPEFVVEEGLPIHLRGEEYPEIPAWRPIFASEIGSPEEEEEEETPPVFELTDVVGGDEPEDEPAPVEPLSIAALMARLEAGMERRAAEAVQLVQAPPEPVQQPIGDDFGTFRNVLDELQRMAVR